MAAKDLFHDNCVRALQKDGWTITEDPLTIPYKGTEVLVDIGAERLFAAERDGERIAVEVKSFIKPSVMQDLRDAMRQFFVYEDAIEHAPDQADRILYLAIRQETYEDVFLDEVGQRLLRRGGIRMIVFDANEETITLWTK